MIRLSTTAVLLLVGCCLCGRPAAGEILVLDTGGRVAGKLLNADESPREKYVIQLTNGSRLTLAAGQVVQVLHTRPEELQYEQVRPQYPDTVDGHWTLAEWCRERGLADRRTEHLRRIVELDPNHTQARRALGYSQVQGEWKTQEEYMLEQGYRRYRGRWMTTQQIELLEKQRTQEVAEKEWAQKIRRWREWLGTDRDTEGRQNILAVTDPLATAALKRLIEEDRVYQARLLYVDALEGIGTPAARAVLAERSIVDPHVEVRERCLDRLEESGDHSVVEFFVHKLHSKDNRVVNQAAVGLARMRQPSAIGPLINALVTTHKYKLVSGGGSGSMSTTFGSSGGGGLSVGGSTKIISRQIANQGVLDALVVLTGQNFSFDQRAWKYWHSTQKKRAHLDARRN